MLSAMAAGGDEGHEGTRERQKGRAAEEEGAITLRLGLSAHSALSVVSLIMDVKSIVSIRYGENDDPYLGAGGWP